MYRHESRGWARESATMRMMGGKLLRISMVALVLVLGTSSVWAQSPPPSLDACEAQIDRDPHDPSGYYCIYRWALAGGSPDEAVTILRRYFRKNPRAYRIEMLIAWIDRIREGDDWRETLRHAVDGMESAGDDYGVVYGGLMLAFELGQQGKLAESEAMLERCARAAERTGDATMQARVWVGQGALATRRQDYSQDIHLLRQAEKAVFPDGPYDIRATVVDNLGSDYWYLCQYRKAFEAFQRATRLRKEAHDLWWQAITVHDMAVCAMSLRNEGEMSAEAVDELLKGGLDLAERSRNAEIEAAMHVLAGRQERDDGARRHYERALEIARSNGYADTEIEALEGIGNSLAEQGPPSRAEAERYLAEAESRARQTGQRVHLGHVMVSKARLDALFGTPQQAVQAHLKTLDFIEDLRAPQVRGTVRAQAFSHWDFVYYRLAGLLLARAELSKTPVEDRALAFRTMERFRARELLDRLATPRQVSRAMVESELFQRHRVVLQEISEVQLALADPDLDATGRKNALIRLGELEEDESRLRDELQRRFPGPQESAHPAIPELREVQALLGPGQALLAYQLWDGEPETWPHLEIGQSWLLLVTRDRAGAIGLPPRRDLRVRVGILEGLLTAPGSPSGEDIRAAVRLYDDLLATALEELPAGIRRLVIVPDDALYRCPFAALRSARAASPVGARFEITTAPSAAVWAHLKGSEQAAGQRSRQAALILYAPAAWDDFDGTNPFRSAGPWREGFRLAPLPHAAEEARALERAAGHGSRILTGTGASEAALKEMSLGSFGIIDLVTHAVVDEEQPERSAIILAPGNEGEDGFLQVREIPDLHLDGQLVILSSCGSSSGRLLGGEGAQSLARAFLEGGAGAVLASLWPLEDEQAASLFGDLSKELGRGRRVSDALRRAQRHAVDRGMPVEAWAGVIVVGDGDVRPLPGHPASGRWVLALIFAGLVLLAAFLARRSR